jgi:WD40 repeat protein
MEKLPVSSKGCVAIPVEKLEWKWLSIRSEHGGIFGKVLKPSPERYRRVQMDALGTASAKFDCPTASAGDQLDLRVNFPDRIHRENLLLQMDLAAGKNQDAVSLQLELAGEAGDQFLFDLRSIKEGSYQAKISLIDLLNLPNNLKGFDRSCPVRIDRTPPKVNLMLRNGQEKTESSSLRLAPGEAVEFKADDASPTRIMSCWSEKSHGQCQTYVEAGARVSAPNEGEWLLEYFAIDGAGNTSVKTRHEVAIFDADRVGRIVGWIDEARLYLKQESYFEAAKRLYQAAWTTAGLKTDAERSFVQKKLRFPFLSLLVRNVPLNRFRMDDGVVTDLWGVSGRTFLALIDGERRLGRILRLYDLSGKILKESTFEDDAIFRFSWSSKKVLIWRPNGDLQLYNQELTLEKSYNLSRTTQAAILSFQGHHALVSQDDGIFHLDLSRPRAELLGKVQERRPAAALSYSAKWLVYEAEGGIALKNLEDGSIQTKTFVEPVEDLRFALFAETFCIKFKKELKCGEPAKVLRNEYYLQGEDAVGAFAIHPYAKVIGYVGTKKVYHYDSTDGTFYFKPYLKSVFSLYFSKEILMLESTDGPLSWVGLPNDAGEPRPYDPSLRPKIVKTSTDHEQVFYRLDLKGLYNVVLRAAGFGDIPFPYLLRDSLIKLDKMALLPDQSHLLALDFDSHINIYSTGRPLVKAYAVDCQTLSPRGNLCTFAKDGKMHFGELAETASRYSRTGEFAGISPHATSAWDPGNQSRLAFFYNNDVTAFEFKDGSPRRIFHKEYIKDVWQVKWLGSRYLAISDGITDIEVWDLERDKKIFAHSDRLGVESMFHIPIDYSSILDSFVVVGKGDDSFPIVETWKSNQSAPVDSHKFSGKDMEYAQILKFMDDGKLLLIGFHHGHVYAIKDLGKPLRPGNIVALKEHQDVVSALGFLQNGKQAYTISEDGSILLHQLEGDFASESIVKSDYLYGSGWLEEEQLFWAQYINNSTVFYDKTGRVVERGDVGLSFVGEWAVLDFAGKALFNWNRFDVWQTLCQWSPQLARKAMDDLEVEWKGCDAR